MICFQNSFALFLLVKYKSTRRARSVAPYLLIAVYICDGHDGDDDEEEENDDDYAGDGDNKLAMKPTGDCTSLRKPLGTVISLRRGGIHHMHCNRWTNALRIALDWDPSLAKRSSFFILYRLLTMKMLTK